MRYKVEVRGEGFFVIDTETDKAVAGVFRARFKAQMAADKLNG